MPPEAGGLDGLSSSSLSYSSYPALVLNADYQPLSLLPLSLWSWQEAIKAVFSGRVTVVDRYDAPRSSEDEANSSLLLLVAVLRAPTATQTNLTREQQSFVAATTTS